MSLVNEALKKARLKAARQEAARKGIALPAADEYLPRRPIGNPLLVAVAALLLLALGALFFWAGRSSVRTRPAAEPAAAAPSPAEPAHAAAGTDELATGRVAATDRPRPTVEIRPQSQEVAAPAVEERREQRTPAPPAAYAAVAPVGSPPAVPPVRIAPEERSSEGGGRRAPAGDREDPVYVGRVDLPGGPLELSGIAWSETRPFALINGRVVGPGDRIEEYTVVDVLRQAVELRGDAGRFFLRLE